MPSDRIGSRSRFDATTVEALRDQLNAAFKAVGSGAAPQVGVRLDLGADIPTAAPQDSGSPNYVMADSGSGVYRMYWWNGTDWVTPLITGDEYTDAEIDALFTAAGFGAGTAGFLPKWTDTNTLGNSLISDDGTDLTFASGDVIGSGASFGFRQSTADGADDARLLLSGGGSHSSTRGARVLLHGNEHAVQPGDLQLVAGSTGDIQWTGNFLASADNTYDIGADGATRPRSVYIGARYYGEGAQLTAGVLEVLDSAGVGNSPMVQIYTDDSGPWPFSIQNASYNTNRAQGLRFLVDNAGDSYIYIAHGGAADGDLVVKTGGVNERLRVAPAAMTVTTQLLFGIDNTYDIGASGATRPRRAYIATDLFVGTTKVVGTRVTGWSASTGTVRRAAVTDATTLINLCQSVSTLINDLRTHGLIGT